MASRYWILGSGSWDVADTSHWAATSGGAPGASVPSAADDVFFDSLSNATGYTVTITALAQAKSLSFAAPASGNVTWAGSSNLNVSGSLTLYAGLIRTFTGNIAFVAGTTGHTITLAGVQLASTISFAGNGGGWTNQDAFYTTPGIGITAGSWTTNGQLITSGSIIVSSLTGVRAITLGSSTVRCAGWSHSGTNTTFNAGTSSIEVTANAATFTGGGLAYYDVTITNTGASPPSITGANSYHNVRLLNTTIAASFSVSANQSASGDFSAIGIDSDKRIAIVSSVPGTPRTITAGALYLSNADPSADIVFVGPTGDAILAPAVLSYNSKHIFLTQKAYRFDQPDRHHVASRGVSASGIVETLNIRVGEIISLSFRNFRKSNAADATLKRNIQQWLQWAQNGNDWSFALYGAESFLTTLSVAAAVGATTLTPASVAGIQAGRTYILRSSTQMDIVKVLTVGASTITLAEGLNFAFAIGDRFRSEYFWPGKLMEASKPIVDRHPLFWDLDLDFIEDANDL